jgi:hypothetical protein
MPEPVGEDRQVKFVLTRAADYRIVAANGVWGGVTSRGDFRADFFVESVMTPESVSHLVNPDGKLGRELSRVPSERPYVRELQVGLVLTLEHAESIGRWLVDKVEDFKKRQGEKQ